MANETVPVGQIDYKIQITVVEDGTPVDLSAASTKQVILYKPDGTTVTGTATFETDGTDGVIYYKTVAGDLDQAGWYSFRGYVIVGSFTGYTGKGRFLGESP